MVRLLLEKVTLDFMEDFTKIALGLLAAGVFLFFLGILLLLDRALLVMSNILILMSIFLLMGIKQFLNFAIQKDRLHGTLGFFVGVLLVFIKYPLPGIICEIVGAYWLFGGFLPMLSSLLLKVPFLFNLLPFLAKQKEELPL